MHDQETLTVKFTQPCVYQFAISSLICLIGKLVVVHMVLLESRIIKRDRKAIIRAVLSCIDPMCVFVSVNAFSSSKK